MDAAIVAVNDERFGVLKAAAGIRIKRRSPVRGPFSAIPGIKTVIMLAMGNAVVPMVVNINVIEADVVVVIMVTPSPSVCTPPRLSPASEP